MKWYKVALVVCLSFVFSDSYAQMIKDNSVWTFEAKKKSGTQYELVAHLKLEKGWHIYAMKPGGDGMQYPPQITFNKNAAVQLKGAIKEKGKLISEKMEGIDGTVNSYAGHVDYIQQATINGTTTITGKYTYQICNDRMCLPATTKTFKIVVPS